MPWLRVDITGEQPIKLEVDSAEVQGTPPGQLVAKKDGKMVGEWNVYSIVGWWLLEHPDDPIPPK
jgi:hypothetical protein